MLQLEYYNDSLQQNTALKIKGAIGNITPGNGYAFGVKSALTNLETVSSTLVEGYNAVVVHTLTQTVATETTVVQYVSDCIDAHNTSSTAHSNQFDSITEKIPAQASSSNQLADKNFVNSSIATNTANFIGTFNSVADLEAYSGTVTNNDYAFVIVTDATGNTAYDRYKYTTATTPASWVFEYELNNSSFTANQWAAINSGITSGDVSLIRTALQPEDLPTVGNGTITLTQGGITKGVFTTNQGSDTTINLDAGSDGSYHPDLFDWKWADHELDDTSWLRSDTFSWQQGSVYKAAYKHLRNDMFIWYSWENNGTTIYTKKAYPEVGEKVYSDSALTTEVGEITAVTDTLDITVEKITVNGVVYDSVSGSNIAPTTETVGGVTVQYIPAEDGHKIVTDFHESEVADVYTATGVAWYYIIDYGFKRFKLPRTKFGFTGLRDTVGNYVAPGLPNITGEFKAGANIISASGAFARVNTSAGENSGGGSTSYAGVDIDASRSSSIYGNSTTVQPPATQMYLYFYVGEFTQTAIENTAGLNAELFNKKVDLDSSWGFPSDTYDDLTLGASGTTYTAPADGYILIACTGDAGKAYMEVCGSGNKYLSVGAACNGGWGRGCGAVAKGQSFSVYYGGTNFAKQLFRFVYAKKSN